MAIAGWIEQLTVDRAMPSHAHVIQGVHCQRVGRNDVWRVRDGNAVYFVTFCKSAAEFHRRLAGIELCDQIARGTPSIGSPRLEAVIASTRTIVTHRANGVSVDRLFRDAYRLDKNPFRLRKPRDRFVAALEAIQSLLSALHGSTPISREHLWDHRPESVSERIRSHLDRLSPRVDAIRGLQLPALVRSSTHELGVVLGDTALSNFVLDDRKVTCVDFEDLGVGEGFRDRVLLSQSLKHPLRQLHYWPGDADKMVGIVPDGPWYALYTLEVQLHSVWRALSRPRAARELNRAVESAVRQLTVLTNASGSQYLRGELNDSGARHSLKAQP